MAAAGRAGRSSDLSGLIASCVDNGSSLWLPAYAVPRRGKTEIHNMSSASAPAPSTKRCPAILTFTLNCPLGKTHDHRGPNVEARTALV